MEFQPKLGDIVGIPLNPQGYIEDGYPIAIKGTVVGVDSDSDGLDICIGFKLRDKNPGERIPIETHAYAQFDKDVLNDPNTSYVANMEDYEFYVWAYHDQLSPVHTLYTQSKPTTPQGVSCSKCGEGNPFGEPNQTDGSYKCGACRR